MQKIPLFIISIPTNVTLNVNVRCKLWLLLGVDLSVITDACQEVMSHKKLNKNHKKDMMTCTCTCKTTLNLWNVKCKTKLYIYPINLLLYSDLVPARIKKMIF